ncbi:tumor necrosis factor receptor [Grouper iridovirus]|uniref:Tumor necrosis factor receptor n=1 Tax=Grouper iridovirus TaxID=127569 RepID=Q5GAJ1_9VIRU|nr:tumor necrosis factor receptor [Grouper iridovirus]
MLQTVVILMTAVAVINAKIVCRGGEFRVSDILCCANCHAGTYVSRNCTLNTGTRCKTCPRATYMDAANGNFTCNPCGKCANNTIVSVECTTSTNTKCAQAEGYYCASRSPFDNCERAEKLVPCSVGYKTVKNGTETANYVCEKCGKGTYSTDGIVCRNHTMCSVWPAISPGTDVADFICVTSKIGLLICSVAIVIALSMCALVAGIIITYRKTRPYFNIL